MLVFLPITIICIIIFNIILIKQNKSFHNSYKKELHKLNINKYEAIYEKHKPFPESFFIQKKLTDFSFIQSEKKSINMFIQNLYDIKNIKIVKPNDTLSNEYLKSIYGVNNLNFISEYEHNYRNYIYALNNLAKVLIDNHLYNEAIEVLNESIYCKSNMSTTYMLYLTAMKNLNNSYTLQDLLKNNEINEIIKNNEYILDKLKKF